jgi:prophage DNA circulation protein
MSDDFDARLRVVEKELAVHSDRWESLERTLSKMGSDVSTITETVTTAKGAAKMGWAIIVAVAGLMSFLVHLLTSFFANK